MSKQVTKNPRKDKVILYLISRVKNDGPNKVLENIINELPEEGIKIYILSLLGNPEEGQVKRIKNPQAKIINFRLKRKFEILTKAPKRLRRLVTELNPDIIHSNGILPDISASIAAPRITVSTIHNNPYEDYIINFGKIKGHFFLLIHLAYLKRIKKCICCSDSIFNALKDKLPNCISIRNTISEPNRQNKTKLRRQIREQYGIPQDSIVYIYVGHLSERKGVIDLVNAFNDTLRKDECLLILGDGEKKNEMFNNIRSKQIVYCGFQDNPTDFYWASDIYCSFSKSEGFSISILEALARDNLLLLNNIPSHKEMFDIDSSYYIGEFFNSESFKEKKEKCRQALSTKDKTSPASFSRKYLNAKEMAAKYLEAYDFNEARNK